MSKRVDNWIETSDVIPMFPTLVWKIHLRPAWRDVVAAQILPALAALRAKAPPLGPGRGWQSEQALHERSEFRDLASCVGDAMKGVLRFLRIGDVALEITACWVTVLAKGAAHRMHSHPNNFLSAVYYLRTHAGADSINFHDPRNQTGIIRPPVLELSAENTDQVVVKVSDGTLLMFPSYLEHSVDPTASEEERISVSFNAMFSSFSQTLSKPLW
jgi:uncharacterized protein (TIGR02466 family)